MANKQEVTRLDKIKHEEHFYVVFPASEKFPDGQIGFRVIYERVVGDSKATAKRTDTGAMRSFPLDMRVVRVSREAKNETLPTTEKSASAVPRPYESPLTSCL